MTVRQAETDILDAIFAEAEAEAMGIGMEVSTGDDLSRAFAQAGIKAGEWPEGQTGTIYPGGAPARLVPIFHAETGVMSLVLPYMIKKLWTRDKLPDGRPAWSRTPVKALPSPQVPCLFNPNNPARPEIEAAGIYLTCTKMLRTAFDAEYHAARRHKHELAMVQHHKSQESEKEYREFQRLQMAVMRKQLGEPDTFEGEPVYSLSGDSSSSVSSAELSEVTLEEPVEEPPLICDACGWQADPAKNQATAMGLHKSRWCKGG